MFKEDKQKKKEYLKEYTDESFQQCVQKNKGNNELRSAEIDAVPSCIKDQV